MRGIPARNLHGSTRSCVAMLGLLFVQACQHVPPAPIDPADNARKLEERSLDDAAVAAALQRYGQRRPETDEWSLDQLTVAAWALRPEIAVAKARLEAARATTRVEAQRPNPTAAGTVEGVTNKTPGVSPWVIGAGLNLTFETAGKRDIRRQRALVQERTLQWQLGEALWAARSAVRNALSARVLAEQTVSLDDEEVSLRRAYLEWIETKLRYGAATSQDRLLAAEVLGQIESQLQLDRAALASASASLATAVGVAPAAFSGIVPRPPDFDNVPTMPASDLAAARELALTNRLDIRRALSEYEAAEQDLRLAVAQQYPNIVLGPGYLFDQGDRKITLIPDLPVPLFHTGAAVVDGAVAARAVAAELFNQVQANALAQIDTSFALYQATLKAYAAARQAEGQARQTFQTAQQRIEAGAADRGEVLGAHIALLVRRRNTLDARRAVVDAVNSLEDGIQKPIFPPSSIEHVGVPESLNPSSGQ
jgi:cobalt-zinc-cadmium efflux system outer membrane protein